MLGEILPDLVLLAIVLAFILRRDARPTAADRARAVSAAWQRRRQIAASTGSRRRPSRASAMATPAERATHVGTAPRPMHGLEQRAPSVARRQGRARSTILPPASEETHHGQP
jgi:hypothetical protein